jgi:hypothetical protein
VAQKFVKSENIAEGGERNAGVRGEGIMQQEGTKITGSLSWKFLHRHRRPICRHCQRNRRHRFVVTISTTPVKNFEKTTRTKGKIRNEKT